MQEFDLQFFGWREFTVAILSFVSCLIMMAAAKLWPRLAGRSHDLSAVQSAHRRTTSRLGGIGIFMTLLLMAVLAPSAMQPVYLDLGFAASILFIVGLLEDIGIHISPRLRLMAAIASSLCVIFLLDVWLPRLGIQTLDHYASHWLIGIPLTLLITVGVTNGFNLIDGVNGLAGFTAMVAALALALIAEQAGLSDIPELSLMLASGILGFLILNFPLGLIFLGDAGAYVLGFILSWFGVGILVLAPTATPWAILLTVFWPVADTALAIYRRKATKRPHMQPDRLHVHQMVMRFLEITLLSRRKRNISNPLTTVILSPFIIAPPLAGVFFWQQPLYAFLSVAGFGILFAVGYFVAFRILMRLRPRYKKRLHEQKDAVSIQSPSGPEI